MSKLNPCLTCIINNSLLKFSYVLLKHIFLKSEKSTLEKEKLNIWIEKINENIIRDGKKFLKVEYSIQNFDNIVSISSILQIDKKTRIFVDNYFNI